MFDASELRLIWLVAATQRCVGISVRNNQRKRLSGLGRNAGTAYRSGTAKNLAGYARGWRNCVYRYLQWLRIGRGGFFPRVVILPGLAGPELLGADTGGMLQAGACRRRSAAVAR
jgi:hypothetical protein